MPQFMQKTSTVVVLLIVIAGVAGYLYYKNHKSENKTVESEKGSDAPSEEIL